MKCSIKNICEHEWLCCNYCGNKNCWQRCKDCSGHCKWFINEKYEEEENNDK